MAGDEIMPGRDVPPPGDFEIVRHPVPAALAGSVLRITGYRETGRCRLRQTETASLVVPLVISFGGPFEIGLGRQPGHGDAYGSFAAGLFAGPVYMRSQGGACAVQVDFTPVGARRFFAFPMRDLADRMVPLDDLSDPGIEGLRVRLADARGWRERFALVERYVGDRLPRSRPVRPEVAWAYGQIVASGGAVAVGEVAGAVGWSRKHLTACFAEDIGLGPKTVGRIARFNRAEAMARAASGSGWADIAAACGYADQAHLVRDFRIFAGTTPAAWLAGAG